MTVKLKSLLLDQQIVSDAGKPTLELVEILQRLEGAVRELQDFQAGVANVTKPTGGATVDAEARTAIDAIVDTA